MNGFKISGLAPGLVAGLLACGLTASLPQSAYAHDPDGLHAIYLTISSVDRKRSTARDSTGELCRIALTNALHEEGVHVTDSRAKADGELAFSGNYLVITEGDSSEIGEVVLNYAAVLKDRNGRTRFSHLGDKREESAAKACTEAAEEITDELADAIDDMND